MCVQVNVQKNTDRKTEGDDVARGSHLPWTHRIPNG